MHVLASSSSSLFALPITQKRILCMDHAMQHLSLAWYNPYTQASSHAPGQKICEKIPHTYYQHILLEQAGAHLYEKIHTLINDVPDIIVCGVGPGYFNRVRLLVACAQSLAYAWHVPLWGACSLKATAEYARLYSSYNEAEVYFDARMQQFYYAHFLHDGNVWQTRQAITLMDVGTCAPSLNIPAIGVLDDTGYIVEDIPPHAVGVLSLALQGECAQNINVMPNYIREKVADNLLEQKMHKCVLGK